MPSLHRTLNTAGAQAAGADVDRAGLAVNDGVNALDIGLPVAAGAVIGMTDVIAGHHAFAADFTIVGHSATSLGIFVVATDDIIAFHGENVKRILSNR